ncbi:hypothetical protein H4Q26_018265 [Puccinia striiformis f. sp. tritici PST-130]|nr:hypothetical protein H4Q26_018265 [Puccinia striiformis f. sp. tritici PST-130]
MTDNSFHLQHNRSSLNYSPALINLTTSTTPNSPAQNPPPIAEPEAQVRRNEETIRKQSRDIKTLNSLLPLATEFSNHKSTNLQELLQIRSGVDVLNNSIDACLSRLENFGTQPAVKPEPPYHQHIFFSGSMKEVSRFNSTMRDTFARLPGHFSGEKHKILYIIGYFRASKDNSSDDCASNVWWRGLLATNAGMQGLNTKKASALDTFVLPELLTSEGFLEAINNQWPNVTEAEDNWKAFESLRQGSTSIGDFNSAFNTLYLQLGINLEPKVVCDYYDKAVNEGISNLASVRGGWAGEEDIKKKQKIAVAISREPVGLSIVNQMVNQKKPLPTRPNQILPLKRPIHTAKLSPGVPMDLDSVSGIVCFLAVIQGSGKLTDSAARALWIDWGGISDFTEAGVSKLSPEHRSQSHLSPRLPSLHSGNFSSDLNGSGGFDFGACGAGWALSFGLDSVSLDALSYADMCLHRQLMDEDLMDQEPSSGTTTTTTTAIDQENETPLQSTSIFNLEDQFLFYGQYHHNPTNIIIHLICVPVIFFTTLILVHRSFFFDKTVLGSFDLPDLLTHTGIYGGNNGSIYELNLATLTSLGYTIYFILLEPIAGLLYSPILLSFGHWSNVIVSSYPSEYFKITLIIWTISWILQFIGHGKFEKRKPALIDNLFQSIVLACFSSGSRPCSSSVISPHWPLLSTGKSQSPSLNSKLLRVIVISLISIDSLLLRNRLDCYT